MSRIDATEEARLGQALEAEQPVLLAYLFGSAARGEALPRSDLDVAVWTDPPMNLLEHGALADRIRHAVGGCRVDLVDLRRAPPLLQYEIVRDGRILVSRNPDLEFGFERAAFQRAEDTRYFRAVQQQMLREAARNGPST